MEDLTLKSRSLQNELDKTRKQLKEVSEVAEDEALKCKSAKEVIKTLTAQVCDHQQNLVSGPIIPSWKCINPLNVPFLSILLI